LGVVLGAVGVAFTADPMSPLPTVKTHLSSLMGKVNPLNGVELAIWAYETGRM